MLRYLPNEFIKEVNLKLNIKGRNAIKRVQKDSEAILFSYHGYNKLGRPEIETTQDKIDVAIQIRAMWKVWHKKYKHLYPKEIQDDYGKYSDVSPRSIFLKNKYWKILGSDYGHNRAFKMENWIREALKDRLAVTLGQFFKQYSGSLDKLHESGDWLANIRTHSNCGYPIYKKQVKREEDIEDPVNEIAMETVAITSMKIFRTWQSNPELIKWDKFPFTPSSRTERKLKARVVFMAALFEKPISAMFNYLVDQYIDGWMVHMPRVEGAIENLAIKFQRFKRAGGRFLSKDYKGFDTSISPEAFDIILEAMEGIDNDFADLFRFEVEIIRRSGMIVAADKLYKYDSLPSGVGPTQWLATALHDAYDYVSGLIFTLVTYQSDDTIGVTNLNSREIAQAFAFQKEKFGLDISPIGEKSYFGDMGIILQTYIEEDKNYGNEKRRFGNGFYRELLLNIKPDLVQFFKGIVTEKAEINVLGNAMSFVGNIGSLGAQAPMLSEFLALWYGPGTGYDWHHIQTVLPLIGQDISGDISRLTYTPQFVTKVFTSLADRYGWKKITVDQVNRVLDSL